MIILTFIYIFIKPLVCSPLLFFFTLLLQIVCETIIDNTIHQVFEAVSNLLVLKEELKRETKRGRLKDRR